MTGQHLAILPILVPLSAGAVLILGRGWSAGARRVIATTSVLVLLVLASAGLASAASGRITVYLVGNWPATAGIALVLDRLSAVMLMLVGILALAGLVAARAGADRTTPHFHALFQFQLMGLNGAFLTGDLFNLFVFFEVLLIASYALLLQGGGRERLRAAMGYVVLNLTGSALFLIGVSLLFGVTGTLNLADLAQRVGRLTGEEAQLAQSAALLLVVVFGIKAAVLPLGFWLPGTYAAASVPVAVLFAVMTKVGVYAILRVHGMLLGDQPAAGGWPASILTVAGLATLLFGSVGAYTARTLPPLIGFLVVGSAGLLVATLGLGSAGATAAALYYLVQSTLVGAALFLIAGAIGDETAGRRSVGLGLLFLIGAAAAASVPPSPGFIAKIAILSAARDSAIGSVPGFWAAVLVSALLVLMALARHGARVFWNLGAPARGGFAPGQWLGASAGLLIGVLGMTVFAAPAQSYLVATANALTVQDDYRGRVLNATPIARRGAP